jgi:hypothetical protein
MNTSHPIIQGVAFLFNAIKNIEDVVLGLNNGGNNENR